MRNAVAIVADDLTGAADTGGAFLAAGLPTIVSWPSIVLSGAALEDTDVLSVDLETRIGDRARARDVTTRVVRAMRERGARAIYKKCDSILRGHIAVEVRAALDAWHPSSVAVVAFAFPDAGRTTIGGRQHVHGSALDRPSIPHILREEALSTRCADLATVRGGALAATLGHSRSEHVDAVVCDAETNGDLDAIAQAGAALGSPVVWVGSGGLARALPRALALERRSHAQAALARPEGGPILFAIGSTSKIARAQAARAIAAGAAHVAVPIDVLEGRGLNRTGDDLAQRIERHLRDSRDVVATIGTLDDVDVEQRRVTDALGALLKSSASIAGGLVVTGGDTATSVLRAVNTTALRLLHEIEPGVPIAMSIAPRPVPVVTKAGAFGDPDTLVRAASRLRELFA
jgi:4-hydroxythreonine-4-phosphate dehydrogenase